MVISSWPKEWSKHELVLISYLFLSRVPIGTVEAVRETADVASDVVTKLWQSIVIASLLSGTAP